MSLFKRKETSFDDMESREQLKKINEQLGFLERKLDSILESLGGRGGNRHGSQGGGRGFFGGNRDQNRGDRGGNREGGFRGGNRGGNRDRGDRHQSGGNTRYAGNGPQRYNSRDNEGRGGNFGGNRDRGGRGGSRYQGGRPQHNQNQPEANGNVNPNVSAAQREDFTPEENQPE